MNPLISGIRTAEIGANALPFVARFYEEVWSLRPLRVTPERADFAGTIGDYPILSVIAGKTSMRRLTFNVRSPEALAELHGRVKAAGLPVSAHPGPLMMGMASALTASIRRGAASASWPAMASRRPRPRATA